jgi:hypothetical protein
MMSTGELLTRITIWLAIVAYTAGSFIFALSRRRTRWDAATRIIWTLASISLVAHVVCAFQFYHGWSHASAYLETARQTKAVVGLNWGGGLFINYILTIGWILDVGWWWWSGLQSYRQRPWQLLAAWHGFLIFIIFNATFVFKTATVRWVGLCICVSLCVAWFYVRQTSVCRHG